MLSDTSNNPLHFFNVNLGGRIHETRNFCPIENHFTMTINNLSDTQIYFMSWFIGAGPECVESLEKFSHGGRFVVRRSTRSRECDVSTHCKRINTSLAFGARPHLITLLFLLEF